MMSGFTRRGQPLLALALLLGGWVSARAMMWEPQAALQFNLSAIGDELAQSQLAEDISTSADIAPQADVAVSQPVLALQPEMPVQPNPERQKLYAGSADAHAPLPPFSSGSVLPPAPPPALSPAPVPVRTVMGHQLLWMAALARVPMPADFASLVTEPSVDQRLARPAVSAAQSRPKRWSADGWILWRRGSTGIAAGGLLTPSYGASQAGAVMRYRLAPSSALRPAAYLRTTAALNGSSEREAALGLQLRPVASLPIAVAGEARLTAVPGRTFVRPAVYAVTEIAPFALPLGLRGEVYGQAGYVGGRFATGFADGHVRVERRLVALGKGELRLGGGLWGGAQKGASRLDAGPTVTIGQPLGGSGSLNLAADWRFRIAGKAAPGSGPAVTLSAGF